MTGGPVTILLIEDNPGDVRLLRETLAEGNCTWISLTHVSSLRAGMDRLAMGGIDGVLLDLALPDSEGLDTLSKVQKRAADLPIIVLTGLDDQALAEKAVREGAQDYLLKCQLAGDLLCRSIRYAIERKWADKALREMEKRARTQEKLASLGQVATGIAHEIRNPLSGLNIYLSMLEKIAVEGTGLDVATRDAVAAIVAQLQSASGKIESVIGRVMDFTKPHPLKLTAVDVNPAVEEAFALSKTFLSKKRVRVTTMLDVELPRVLADLRMLEQVLLNLVTNAAQAMEKSQERREIQICSFREGNAVVISVADSGPGVPVEFRDKIFEPFFTTRSDGSGIGLSICHRIVSDHRGTLTVGTSALGGAEFRIVLPAHGGAAPE